MPEAKWFVTGLQLILYTTYYVRLLKEKRKPSISFWEAGRFFEQSWKPFYRQIVLAERKGCK